MRPIVSPLRLICTDSDSSGVAATHATAVAASAHMHRIHPAGIPSLFRLLFRHLRCSGVHSIRRAERTEQRSCRLRWRGTVVQSHTDGTARERSENGGRGRASGMQRERGSGRTSMRAAPMSRPPLVGAIASWRTLQCGFWKCLYMNEQRAEHQHHDSRR